MFKTYIRLLGFAKPLSRYAVPYFFYAALHAVFNTFNYVMIIPILDTMFSEGYQFTPVYEMPKIRLNGDFLSEFLNYLYTITFGEYKVVNVLLLLAVVLLVTNFLSNLFRYLGGYTVESMRANTLQRMRNDMFENIIGMNVGYFSDQRKGDIISKITSDVMMVQFCITNTLQVAFREPFLIIGFLFLMFSISWELSVFSIIFLPLVGVVIGSIVKRLRHPAKKGQERMGDMVSVLDEALSGIKELYGRGVCEAQVPQPECRIYASGPLDGPQAAAGIAHERVPRNISRLGHSDLRRHARDERVAERRRVHSLHCGILADYTPRAFVHRPVRQHQPGYCGR